MLLAIGLRTVFGAPCCMPPAQAAELQMDAHAHHGEHSDTSGADSQGHAGHGDDPTAKPCCSACGPTLPPEPAVFTALKTVNDAPKPSAIRELATRPPYPAYEATGPPLLI